MSRAIIRVLFGECDSDRSWESKQRRAVNNDFYDTKSPRCATEPPFICYVAGTSNLDLLKSKGSFQNLRLINEDPWPWPKQALLRNKIHLIGAALKKYDEVLFLDWDCIAEKPADPDFVERMWKDLESGAPIRTLSWQYIRPLCPWRTGHPRKCANTGFLYARRDIWPRVEVAWETTNRHFNDEVAVTWLQDELAGGWSGIEKWTETYDVQWARMKRQRPCPDWMWEKKLANAAFVHDFR